MNNREKLAYGLRAGTTYSYHYSKTYTYSRNTAYECEVSATLNIWTDGTMYKQINSILGVGSRRIDGNGNYDWIQMYPYSTPTNSSGTYPTTSVRIGATGYFEVRTTIGGSIGFSLEGFEFAGEMSGQDIYQSDTLYCESTYSLY